MTIAAADRIPETRWPGVVVRRYRGRLYVEATGVDKPNEGSLAVAGGETLRLVRRVDDRTCRRTSALDSVASACRRGSTCDAGQAVRHSCRRAAAHHRPLRKWLQEHDVLPWRRENLPLLYAGESRWLPWRIWELRRNLQPRCRRAIVAHRLERAWRRHRGRRARHRGGQHTLRSARLHSRRASMRR